LGAVQTNFGCAYELLASVIDEAPIAPLTMFLSLHGKLCYSAESVTAGGEPARNHQYLYYNHQCP
jgi:hypothetical protein